MALVNITNVMVMDNPTSYLNPFQFEVTFECLQELQDGKSIYQHELHVPTKYQYHCLTQFLCMDSDIEWKVTYVGSAEDSSRDQVLEEVMVGPVPVGVNRFILQADAPNNSLIATSDLIGVTVVLITCSYMDQEFVKIGYYVNNEYNHPAYDPEGPLPTNVDTQYLFRNILADKPIVTRINIDWSGQQGGGEGGQMMMMPPPPLEMEGLMDDNEMFAVRDDQEVMINEDSMDVEQVQVEARRVL